MINGKDDQSFRTVWQQIVNHAGERFATKTGLPFTYETRGDGSR